MISELSAWHTYIVGLAEDVDKDGNGACTITSDIESENSKDGSGPLVTNVDACDTNGDGIAVIDIDRGGSDFKVADSDWILQGDGSVFPIFRIRGGSNMLMSNAAILLGDGGIGGGSASDPITEIGALFVKAHPTEEGTSSSDQVFNGNNVILNGIGLWDLVTVGDTGTTELIINNGQGCAQFISSAVTFNDVRWNRCAHGAGGIADLQIEKTANRPSVVVGNALSYTLKVTNNGPDDATDVQVVDKLPTQLSYMSATPSQGVCSESGGLVTCDLGDLANGGIATVILITTVVSAP